jgi:hypothetical protein
MMAGEFLLPNYTMPQAQSYGVGQGTNFGFNQPQATMSPDQVRFAQINQQMQPSTFLPYLNAGIQGAGMLGNLFLGIQSLRAANANAAWQRSMAENNYANSVRSYNTAVEDKVKGRYSATTLNANRDAVNDEINRRKIGGG